MVDMHEGILKRTKQFPAYATHPTFKLMISKFHFGLFKGFSKWKLVFRNLVDEFL